MTLVDLAPADATEAAGVSTSGAAALVSLAAHPGVILTELGCRVGLTQSATARMVDTLEANRLVERVPARSAVLIASLAKHPSDRPVHTYGAVLLLKQGGGPARTHSCVRSRACPCPARRRSPRVPK